MICVQCKTNNYGFEHHEDDLCIRCLDIAEARIEKRLEWEAFHDGPCPSSELPQFPKPYTPRRPR